MEHLNYKELKAYRKNVTTYTSNKEIWVGRKQELSLHKWYKALTGLWAETYFRHMITEIHPDLLEFWKFNVPIKVNTYKRQHKTIDLDAVFVTNQVLDIKSYTKVEYYNTSYKPDFYCIIRINYDVDALQFYRGIPMIMNTNSWDYYLNPENVIFNFLGIQSKQDVWSNRKFLEQNYQTDLKLWMKTQYDKHYIQ